MLLNVRMKRITSQLLKNLIQIETLKESALGLSKLSGKFQLSKLFWLIIIIGCFIGLCIQTYLRIAYYFQYPVAVDAHNIVGGEVPFPPLMFCSYDTPAIADIWRRTELPVKSNQFDWNCVNPFYSLIKHSNLSIDELYRAANMSAITTEIFINKKRKDIALNIKFTYIPTPFSTCLLLKLDGKELHSFAGSSVRIKFHKLEKDVCGKEAPYFSCSLPYINIPSLEFAVVQIAGTKMKLWFEKTKYTFVNSPLKNCVDDETFANCISKCLINHLNKVLTCRFPFTPSEINKPICVDRKEAEIAYSKTLNFYADLDFINDCKCTKKCEELVHQLNAQSFLIDGHKSEFRPCDTDSSEPCYTEIEIFFPGTERIEFKERFVYKFSDLIADFGANLSLFLGLSILSLLENLQTYWRLWKFRVKVKRIAMRDKMRLVRLSKLVLCKTLADERKKIVRGKKRIDLIKILYYCLFFISILSIYNRLRLYWDEPVNTIVVIQQADMIQFPDITICGEESDLSEHRIQRAKEMKKDSCKLLPWELVDLLPIEELWDSLSLENSFWRKIDVFEHYGTPSINTFNKISVDLPHGRCSKFISPGPTKFRGSWGMGSIVMLRFDEPDEYCAKKYFLYFITPRGEPIDLTAINSMPFNAVNGLWLQEKRVQHVNAKSKPCVNNDIYFKCEQECFERKLSLILPKIKCRLPYMKENGFPLCNSSKTALLAHNTYMKIYQQSKLYNECKCLRRCNETYYDTRVFNPPTVKHITFFNYLFHSNLIETFLDVLIYPFSVFISDIGSILGLTVGFSLLSFSDHIVELKNWIWGCPKIRFYY